MLVIDTQIMPFDYPILAMKEEDPTIPSNSFGTSLVMVPSENAIRLMLAHAGFESVYRIPITKDRRWKTNSSSRRYLQNVHASFIAWPDGKPGMDSPLGNYRGISIARLQQRVAYSAIKPSELWRSGWNDWNIAKRLVPSALAKVGVFKLLRLMKLGWIVRGLTNWLQD